mgnify:CR=1 FL=1
MRRAAAGAAAAITAGATSLEGPSFEAPLRPVSSWCCSTASCPEAERRGSSSLAAQPAAPVLPAGASQAHALPRPRVVSPFLSSYQCTVLPLFPSSMHATPCSTLCPAPPSNAIALPPCPRGLRISHGPALPRRLLRLLCKHVVAQQRRVRAWQMGGRWMHGEQATGESGQPERHGAGLLWASTREIRRSPAVAARRASSTSVRSSVMPLRSCAAAPLAAARAAAP